MNSLAAVKSFFNIKNPLDYTYNGNSSHCYNTIVVRYIRMTDYLKFICSKSDKYFVYTDERSFKDKFEELIYPKDTSMGLDTGDFFKGEIQNNKLEIFGQRIYSIKTFFVKIDGELKKNSDEQLELSLNYRIPFLGEILFKLIILIAVIFMLTSGLKAGVILIPLLGLIQYSYITMVNDAKIYFEEYFLGTFKRVEILED